MPRAQNMQEHDSSSPRNTAASLRRSSRLQLRVSGDGSSSVRRRNHHQSTVSYEKDDVSHSSTSVQTQPTRPPLEDVYTSLSTTERKRRMDVDDDSHSKKSRSTSSPCAWRDDDTCPAKMISTVTPSSGPDGVSRADHDEDIMSNRRVLHLELDAPSLTASSHSSLSSSQQLERPALPKGVVDLYPSAQKVQTCSCGDRHTSSSSLTESYLATYGWEYYQSLKETEDECFSQPSLGPSSDDCSTSIGDSISRSTTSHSTWTNATPAARHQYINTINRMAVMGTKHAEDETVESLDRQPNLTPKMRAILIDWLIELSEEYKLKPMTLQLAVALVDKSLSGGAADSNSSVDDSRSTMSSAIFTVEREMLQCLGCSCMWIAAKIEEVEPPSVDDFVYISDNSYTRTQITDMEMTVCTALKFRLCQVTPYHFIHEFLRASCACSHSGCPACENPLLNHMTLYLLELSLLSHDLVHVKPSLIAAAVVYLARATLGIHASANESAMGSKGLWTKTLQHYTGYDLFDLEDTVLALHRYQCAAEDSQLQSVFTKFQGAKYSRVSLKTIPLESDLGF